jgi:uncharacterized protein (TIGR03000 family)
LALLFLVCFAFETPEAEDRMLYRLSLPVVLGAMALAGFISQPAMAAEKTHEGKIVKAADGKLTMTNKDGSNRHTHDVSADAKITSDGKEVKLDELKEGYFVKVTTNTDDNDKSTVTRIEARETESASEERGERAAAPAERGDRARVRVMVPTREARVWFENDATKQQGTDRLYTSPPLERGRPYHYTIKASWLENGREITREQTVPVRAGQEVVANFTEANDEYAPGTRRRRAR